VEMLSKTPAVASAAGELALYVDRMPMPTAMPTGVVIAKNAASPRYGTLRGPHSRRMCGDAVGRHVMRLWKAQHDAQCSRRLDLKPRLPL